MRTPAGIEQPKILVIENEFVSEMKLALEYAGRQGDDSEAMRTQLAAIIDAKDIGAAILHSEIDLDAATVIADLLVELEVPFVLAGRGTTLELPESVMALTMSPALAKLTVLGQTIFGRPTYH
jgi:ABC-type uncharacterized transport system ATPase subunit